MFHYKECNVFFSFTVYLIVQPLTIHFYVYVQRLHSKLTMNIDMRSEV